MHVTTPLVLHQWSFMYLILNKQQDMKFLIQKQTYIYMGLASFLLANHQCGFTTLSNTPDRSGGLNLRNCINQQSITDNSVKLPPFDFKKEIEAMREAADKKRGITWTLTGDNLLRDATQSTGSVYASQEYVVQIISICRAATRMCELYEKEEQGKKFESIAQDCIRQYQQDPRCAARDEQAWFNQVEHTNKFIVGLLQGIFPEKSCTALSKELRIIENYAGLEDTHYNVTTISNLIGQKFNLEDKKWLKLTDAQKAAFIGRKTLPWYTNLSELEQRLVDHYLDKFLDDNHCIPTQIRNLPGCRNAYQTRLLACDEKGNSVPLTQYAHLATLSALNTEREISDAICAANWDQLCQHVSDPKALKFICLNHNQDAAVFRYVGEKQIIEQTKRVMGEDAFTCFPINHMGRLLTPVFKPQVYELYKEGKLFKAEDPESAPFREKLDALKAVADSSDGINKIKHNMPSENLYAEASSDYIFCKSFLNRKQKKEGITEVVSCKSGKDRTGYISFLSDAKLIKAHLRDLATEEDVQNVLATTAHVQFLAGANGGMPGRFGLKCKGLKTGSITSKFAHNLLFCQSALSTSIKG